MDDDFSNLVPESIDQIDECIDDMIRFDQSYSWNDNHHSDRSPETGEYNLYFSGISDQSNNSNNSSDENSANYTPEIDENNFTPNRSNVNTTAPPQLRNRIRVYWPSYPTIR